MSLNLATRNVLKQNIQLQLTDLIFVRLAVEICKNETKGNKYLQVYTVVIFEHIYEHYSLWVSSFIYLK